MRTRAVAHAVVSVGFGNLAIGVSCARKSINRIVSVAARVAWLSDVGNLVRGVVAVLETGQGVGPSDILQLREAVQAVVSITRGDAVGQVFGGQLVGRGDAVVWVV